MELLKGLIPLLIYLVEMPGNGNKKHEIVLETVDYVLKNMGIKIDEDILSKLIDSVVEILNV